MHCASPARAYDRCDPEHTHGMKALASAAICADALHYDCQDTSGLWELPGWTAIGQIHSVAQHVHEPLLVFTAHRAYCKVFFKMFKLCTTVWATLPLKDIQNVFFPCVAAPMIGSGLCTPPPLPTHTPGWITRLAMPCASGCLGIVCPYHVNNPSVSIPIFHRPIPLLHCSAPLGTSCVHALHVPTPNIPNVRCINLVLQTPC